VQVVPHITNAIKKAFLDLEDAETDVILVEIGGTVGDIEGLPYLEAVRQFGLERPRGDVMYVHLTLIPFLQASGEIKTKPTQHSVQKLREIGIQPDLLICRTVIPLASSTKEKIAMFCSVRKECVIDEKDVDFSIYEVPLLLRDQKVDQIVCETLRLNPGTLDVRPWEAMLAVVKNPEREVEIALVGKYTAVKDSYKSIFEALAHGGIANRSNVKVRWIVAEELEDNQEKTARLLEGVGGILVPGGFGRRGAEGKMAAIRWARENKVPFFGICYGLQCAVIEYARNVCGIQGACSAEWFDEEGVGDLDKAFIAMIDSMRKVTAKGGTMRLGHYACGLKRDTRAREAYGEEIVRERHRHRYEVNPNKIKILQKSGLVISGTNPDSALVEIIELSDHPWFIGVQFHPEFQSTPIKPHPLFSAFVKASLEKNGKPARREKVVKPAIEPQ